MRQRLDIADVEASTKIRAKYLRALENEEFGMLPGPTFVKTFLRTYAEALGLDPHLLVEEYRAHYEAGDDVEHIQSLGPPNLARDRRRRGPRLGPGRAAPAGRGGRRRRPGCDRAAGGRRRRRRRGGLRDDTAHETRPTARASSRSGAGRGGWC